MGVVPACFEGEIAAGLQVGSSEPLFCDFGFRDTPASHLAHASDPRHDGIVEEVELFPRLAEEEVNLVVVPHGVACRLALLDVSRPNKDWICPQ